MKELLIGCGSNPKKCLFFDGNGKFNDLITLDNNENHKPDVVWDLNKRPLPFEDNTFDEIHAYDVLEHLSSQGDYKSFFAEFTEYARILKAHGNFFASVPAPDSPWVWGDPSHTRCVHPNNITFLSQDSYKNVGKTQMSDFRYIYKADFIVRYNHITKEKFYFILENIK